MRCIATGCAMIAATVFANDIHVSPKGDDRNPGTAEKPVATLQRAVERVRETGPGTVWLDPGEYPVQQGIQLNESIGSTADTPLVIRGTEPRQARITGGKRVADFVPIPPDEARTLISEEAGRHVLVADLAAQGFPELQSLPAAFRAPGCEEVMFGDQPLQPARWPNEGFTAFTEVIDPGASDPIHWVTREVYRPGSFRFPNDRPSQWDFSRGVYLHGFWCYDWADEALKAESYDPENQELRFAAKHGYGIGNPRHKNSRRTFYAVHVFEELDRPGEYYLDRPRRKLYLWPPGDIATTPVTVSICREPLIQATGVDGLTIQDVVLENGTDWAVMLKNCRNTHVQDCLIQNMGLGGIGSHGGSNNHVKSCEITRTGSKAVAMTAGDRKTLTPGNCSVENNHIHHMGRHDWMGGRGVSVGGCGNRVANNLIHHGPTGAVSYGGNEHVIELNEVHNVCILYSDVGVFYTGRDWASRGNVVRWNYIHSNVNNEGSGSQAIYLDDCDSGDTVVGNIVFGGVGRGVLLGGGRDNTIRGNIFIDIPKGVHVDARGPRGITLDKPGSWNLKAKCEALGYQSPLWKKRYPRLATVLEEDPLLPMGNVISHNAFIAVNQPFALSKDVKEAWLERQGNVIFERGDLPFLPSETSGASLDPGTLSVVWEKIPGMDPIPVDRIGLRHPNRDR